MLASVDTQENPRLYSQNSRASVNNVIDCWNTSQVFKVGHRIGLEIASSAFPKYDRNLNTGAPLGCTTEMVVAEQRIYHDVEHPSVVVLPIIPAAPETDEAYEVFTLA
jgi:predicted acyl esterase